MQNLNGNGISKHELRKSNKPIMEKRRRARINHCLNELKSLILEAMKKDPARHSKLEKADILEMTVKHLQSVQRKQLSLAIQTDPTVIHKFKTGFTDCAAEVNRYLRQLEGIDPTTCKRLTNHLNNCATGIEQIGTFTNFSSTGYHHQQHNHSNNSILTGTTTSAAAVRLNNNNNNNEISSIFSTPSTKRLTTEDNVNNNNNGININEMHLIPSRLPNGELALIMPKINSITSSSSTTAAAAAAAAALFLPTTIQTEPSPFYFHNNFPRFSAFTKPSTTFLNNSINRLSTTTTCTTAAAAVTTSPPLSPVSSISSLGDDSSTIMHTSSDFQSKSSSFEENSFLNDSCYVQQSPKIKSNDLLSYASYLQQSVVTSTSELSKLDDSYSVLPSGSVSVSRKRPQSNTSSGLDRKSLNYKRTKLFQVKKESHDDDDDDDFTASAADAEDTDDDDDEDAQNGNKSATTTNHNNSRSLDETNESMWRPW